MKLGLKHERDHLATLGKHADLGEVPEDLRAQRTVEAMDRRESVIYQGCLKGSWAHNGVQHEVIGYPDFLVQDGDDYLVRDSKLSRRINERDHPEILRQLTCYGWLYRQIRGTPAVRLEVHSGTGALIAVEPNEDALFFDLSRIADWKSSSGEFYEPVGWTKCGRCMFHDHCWPRALQNGDLSIVPRLDQGMVLALREVGVFSLKGFLERFDENTLSSFEYVAGSRRRRVGKRAVGIVRNARALASNEEMPIDDPRVRLSPYYVMFDLEGIPAQLDELEKVYLWGLRVFGEEKGPYLGQLAEAGDDGDRLGWERFLDAASRIFAEYGDVPFVHWHHYERTRLDMYLSRFGDRDGIGERLRRNLLDLLPILQDTVALPVHSYSLKVIEKYVGYKRAMTEYGGDWAIARYIESTEIADEAERKQIIEEISAYNQEDLEATWWVLAWLLNRMPSRSS